MKDALARLCPVVHYQPEIISDPVLPRQLTRDLQQPADQRTVGSGDGGRAGDMFSGDDQKMFGSLGIDVPEATTSSSS